VQLRYPSVALLADTKKEVTDADLRALIVVGVS